MAKAKVDNSGEKITETKMDPRKKKSIIVTVIVWIVIIAIIIGILLVLFLPKSNLINIISITGVSPTNPSILLANTNLGPNTQIDLTKSSFATTFVTPSSFSVQLYVVGQGNFLASGTLFSNQNGAPVYTIANLLITKVPAGAWIATNDAGSVPIPGFSFTNSGTSTSTDGTTTTTTTTNTTTSSTITGVALGSSSLGNLLLIGSIKLPDNTTAAVIQLIISIVPFIFIVIVFWLVWRSARRGMGGIGGDEGSDNVFTIGRSQAKLAKSSVRFSDVAGIEEEKNELIEIVDYLKNPGRYAQMGARAPRGIILYGPPGTGKTLLAKAVAGEAGVPFFQVTGSAFEDMLVGVGAKRVRDLFAKAKKAAPCIIFIDEIDSVGSKRGKLDVSNYSVAEQTLNQLLAEMDGFTSRTGVVVMAATNRLDVLDDALLRPGRFDRHIQVTLPDVKERLAILKIHAANKNLSAKVNLEDIARRTPGFSGAQLENVLNEATLLAVRNDRNAITMEDLDEAIDRVMAGPAKKSRVMSESDRKLTAYHEAGHAIVGLHLKGADEVQKITIIPRGQAGGYTLSTPKDAEMIMKRKSDLLNMVAGALGGRAAEEIIFGPNSITTGASNDFYKATNIVRAMVTQLGMSRLGMTQYVPSEGAVNPNVKLYSDKTADEIDKAIDEIMNEQYLIAKKIISENREEHELIVETLLIQETIVKKDIDYIHKEKKLPPSAIEAKKAAEESKAKAANAKTDDIEENKDNNPDKKPDLNNKS